MPRRKVREPNCGSDPQTKDCCRMESLITVDERGQRVLPKDLRDRAKIRAGDRLALVSGEKDGEICCFTLIKADLLAERVKELLGPLMSGLTGIGAGGGGE
jgi:antitoxin PrlF